MKDCEIVKDLLPLVQEGLASEESTAFVRAHAERCASCRLQWEEVKGELPLPAEEEAPVRLLKKKIEARERRVKLLIASLVVLFSMSGIWLMTHKIYLPPESVSLQRNDLGQLIATFRHDVAGFIIEETKSPEASVTLLSYSTWLHRIQRPAFEMQSILLEAGENKAVYYIMGHSGEKDRLIYGEGDENRVTLPRLSLNYISLFLCIPGILSLGTFFFLRKKGHSPMIILGIAIFALSWLLYQIIFSGLYQGRFYELSDEMFFLPVMSLASSIAVVSALELRKEKNAMKIK